MSHQRPFFVIVPGASLTFLHYVELTGLLMEAGYPRRVPELPSDGGSSSTVSVEDDAKFIREKILLPLPDRQQKNIILLTHGYSSIPGSAAAKGLSKAERADSGKQTGVIAQIHVAGILTKGGDGRSVVDVFDGRYPLQMTPDKESTGFLRYGICTELLYDGASEELAEVLDDASPGQASGAFLTPIPPASWGSTGFKNRLAYIQTTRDFVLPFNTQKKMLDDTRGDDEQEIEWITNKIESGHLPHKFMPDKLAQMLIDLAQHFEALERDR